MGEEGGGGGGGGETAIRHRLEATKMADNLMNDVRSLVPSMPPSTSSFLFLRHLLFVQLLLFLKAANGINGDELLLLLLLQVDLWVSVEQISPDVQLLQTPLLQTSPPSPPWNPQSPGVICPSRTAKPLIGVSLVQEAPAA